MPNTPIPSRQSRKKGRIWPFALALLVFFVAAAAGYYFATNSLTEKPAPKKTAEKKEELLVAKDKATIMLMGVDEREDDVGRSDTLMVATIDPKLDKVSLLSIPRDTRVKIKGYGYDKINAAYAYGKERLTHNTVENFLGVDIDHYIIVNTRSFPKIIDAIGGVDIDVEKRMYYEDPWDDDGGLIIDLYPGRQHMDGKTAVTYVRYRDEEGDIGRVTRQQKFLKACMDKLVSPAIIPKLPGIMGEALNSIDTDLSLRELLEFAGTLKTAQRNGLAAEMVPGRPLYIDGISYWIPDIGKLRLALAKTLGITLDSGLKAILEREAREYEESIPASASELPEGDTSIGKAVSTGRIESLSEDRSAKKPSNKTKAAVKTDDEREGKTPGKESEGEKPDSENTADSPERDSGKREIVIDKAESTPAEVYEPTAEENTAESAAPNRSGGVGRSR